MLIIFSDSILTENESQNAKIMQEKSNLSQMYKKSLFCNIKNTPYFIV